MKMKFLCCWSLLLICFMPLQAYAATTDTTNAQVSIQSGSLSLTTPSVSADFGSITVDGTTKTQNVNLGTLNASDYRGTGEGWHVTVSASQFTQTNVGVNPALLLETNTLFLNGISNITQVDGSSGLPTSSGAPWTIDSGAVEILSAAVGDGLGSFDVTFPANALELNVDTSKTIVDPDNNPTLFESTITWTIVAGP